MAESKNETERLAFLEQELQKRDKEIGELKKKILDLEEEVKESQKLKAQRVKEAEEVECLKTQSEDTLTKAKSIIFERTKVIKNQELQIDALNQQVLSLREVVSITKNLLEIRNLETQQLEGKLKCLEEKIACERERFELTHKKLENMIRHNGELKREYETQLCLFAALRERYNERELAQGVLDELRNSGTENVTTQTAAAAGSSSETAVEARIEAPVEAPIEASVETKTETDDADKNDKESAATNNGQE